MRVPLYAAGRNRIRPDADSEKGDEDVRYLIAIIVAIAVALLVTIFLSAPIASWVVRQFAFESPDGVADMHAFVFMAVNFGGLILGWVIGWAIGGVFDKDDPVE